MKKTSFQGRALGPLTWRGNFFNVKKVVYSESGFPAGNFVASSPPNLPTFPAPLRGSP